MGCWLLIPLLLAALFILEQDDMYEYEGKCTYMKEFLEKEETKRETLWRNLPVEGLPAPQISQHVQPQAGSVSTPVPGTILFPVGGGGVGGIRRTVSGLREWRRADPTLIHSLWRSKMGNGIRKQLGKAEVYIMLALFIGLVTVVIGCWLSDNCWSPDPDSHVITVA